MIIGIGLVGVCIGALLMLLASNFRNNEKHITEPLKRLYSTNDPQFRRDMSLLLGPAVVEGNHTEVLLNGDKIFASMLAAICQAKRTITFETYIYWSESIGEEFATALSDRARAGIKVHLLLDWIGSFKIENKHLEAMRDAGVEVERFHQPHWSHLPRFNNRTHRKVLVIDGALGFTGGVGIADQWRGNAQDENHWRDTHFRVTGPVVAQMQAVFADNWAKATSRVLNGEDYFPQLPLTGTMPAQMFMSSPSGGSESMHLMYLMTITAAEQSIDLSSSYFVPDSLTVATLVAAAKRGVKIRIITPGRKTDASIVRRASRARWGPLLKAGIMIAEFQPTMFHCKELIVDNFLVSVGSTNFDNRSFRLNDEANLNVFDTSFAKQQTTIFEADLARSKAITLRNWRRRPLHKKMLENAASLLGSQL
ncbi:MAG: cardiolipin synthase [Pseudomonadota bacterium]